MAKEKKMTVQAGAPRRDLGEDTFSPLVDIYQQSDGTTVLVAEVPGAVTETLDIRVDKGVLSIYADARAKQADESYTQTYTGFARGQYFRAFAISDEVDRDNIEAACKDGVLTLTLPRAASATTRKIEIKKG